MMPVSPGKSSCQFFIIYFSLTVYIVHLSTNNLRPLYHFFFVLETSTST